MSIGPKRKEAPTEPLKRAIGLCVRAIAGHSDLEVGFAPGAPEYSTGHAQLPEPSRVPSQREISVIRGWADSFALTAGCHDVRVHNKLAPSAGPARLVFEAAERARVEALGANRMPGMARNLTARIEDNYAHGRYAQVKTRADAPLEDAVALMIRERLTGLPPPDSAKALVDVWRSSVEQRGAKLLKRLDSLAEDQESFGRLMRDLLRALELTEESVQADREENDSDDDDKEEGSDGDTETAEDGEEGSDQRREEGQAEGDANEAQEASETASADDLESMLDDHEQFDTPEPWRPNTSVLDNPEAFGYKVFTREFDEEIGAEQLSSPGRAGAAARLPRSRAARPVERRRAPRQPAAAAPAGAAEPGLGFRPRRRRARRLAPAARHHRPDARAIVQARARHRFPRHGRDAAARQFRRRCAAGRSWLPPAAPTSSPVRWSVAA